MHQLGKFQEERKELQRLIADLQGRRDEEKRLNTELFKLVDNRLEMVRGLYDVVSNLLVYSLDTRLIFVDSAILTSARFAVTLTG